MRSRAFSVVVVALCAACSSGATLPAGRPADTPAAARVAAEPRGGSEPRATASPAPDGTFTIALPASLSGLAKSATVTVAVLPGQPSAPGVLPCSATVCSGNVRPQVGIDRFTVTLFAGPQGSGKILTTGTLVQPFASVPAPGIAVAFGAPFARVAVALSANKIRAGYRQEVYVWPSAFDSSGNVIIGPYSANGSTAFALTTSSQFGTTTLGADYKYNSSPSRPVILTYDGSPDTYGAVTLAASNGLSAVAKFTLTLTAAEINGMLAKVESYYALLPHASLAADLALIQTYMHDSKGLWAVSAVTTGGLWAYTPIWGNTIFFADRPATSLGQAPPSDLPLSTSDDTVAFLVNDRDPAFASKRQHDFANAFVRDGFTPLVGYDGVEALDVSLEDILALGGVNRVDFLDLATHAALDAKDNYFWQSTTPITDAGLLDYGADFSHGIIEPSLALMQLGNVGLGTPSFAFSPQFLAEHVRFTPGAIVDNQSCCGQAGPNAAGLTAAQVLAKAGVGRYYGWSGLVRTSDADESDAFLLDRLLGEQSPSVTGLNAYATQRSPAQRPFPLDDVFGAMQSENRSSPIQAPPGYSYAVSKSPGQAQSSVFTVSDFGGENVAGAPIEYALPSIERLQVAESASTLEIVGRFPPARIFKVAIAGAQGSIALHPTSTNTAFIQVPIAKSGPGSWGAVTVSVGRIASNPVPLTQWAGTLKLSDIENFVSGNGVASAGVKTPWLGRPSGPSKESDASAYTTLFRSDVHPTVVAIDTPPQPQDFYFSNLEAGTSGAFTTYDYSFAQVEPCGAGLPKPCGGYTIALLPRPPAMQSLSGTSNFTLTPVYPRAATCNSGLAGPQPGATNVFCTTLFAHDMNAALCTRAKSSAFGFPWCGPKGKEVVEVAAAWSPLTLVMDPATYAVSLSPNPTTKYVNTKYEYRNDSLSAQFQAPLGAPAAVPGGGI